jgi:uncharacterized protein
MIVTPLYAGLLALLFLLLSWRVVQVRGGKGPSLGDGGDPRVLRRIRGHANFAEYVPLILLMIALLELARFPPLLLHVLGASLVVARALHGYAFAYRDDFRFGRWWGTALTFLLLLVCGGLCLGQYVRAAVAVGG